MWIDRASAETEVILTPGERRRLIAALLSRRHLILSGPSGIGKRRLAYELALSITNGRVDRVCLLQGHPCWAVRTGDVGYFVNMQTSFSAWQLAHFTGSVLSETVPASQHVSSSNHGSQTHDTAGEHIVCVNDMSRFEIELYYRVFAVWLLNSAEEEAMPTPIRLIGTHDSNLPPDPADVITDLTAMVHLSGAKHRSMNFPSPGSRISVGR